MGNQLNKTKGNGKENLPTQTTFSNAISEADLQNDFFMEVKFDKAMQSFLERRGYEHFDITKMQPDTSSTENTNDFEFIHISHIKYDRQQDLSDRHLIDFEQILSTAASRGGRFAYLIDSDKGGINLYLGISKDVNTNSFNAGGGGGILAYSTQQAR